MKKITILFLFALLLSLSVPASAEAGVNVEVMIADGVSVVVLTPEDALLSETVSAAGVDTDGFHMPQYLVRIEERAFEGIAAERVDISENVIEIQKYAFANCENLRTIFIPETVETIDDLALDGCGMVTVYGKTGTEAERFATAANLYFVDPDVNPVLPIVPDEAPPVSLPLVWR